MAIIWKISIFYEDFGSSILSLSLTLNVEPRTCERLHYLFRWQGLGDFFAKFPAGLNTLLVRYKLDL